MEPCPKCYDPESGENRGCYMYDENHGKPCELCCLHERGFSLLLEHYGDRNGMYCCRDGCGHAIGPDEQLALKGLSGQERRSRPSGLAERAA